MSGVDWRYLYSGSIQHTHRKSCCCCWGWAWGRCCCPLHHTRECLQQAHELVRYISGQVLRGELRHYWLHGWCLHSWRVRKVWLLHILWWWWWVLLRIGRQMRRRRIDHVHNRGQDVCIKYGAPRAQQPPQRKLGLGISCIPRRKKQLQTGALCDHMMKHLSLLRTCCKLPENKGVNAVGQFLTMLSIKYKPESR